MDWIAFMLIAIAPLGVYVGKRLAEQAVKQPHIDLLSAVAFREVVSALAGVGYVVIGIHILTGRTLYSQAVGVVVLVASVLLDRLPVLVWLRFFRRWDRESRGRS